MTTKTHLQILADTYGRKHYALPDPPAPIPPQIKPVAAVGEDETGEELVETAAVEEEEKSEEEKGDERPSRRHRR